MGLRLWRPNPGLYRNGQRLNRAVSFQNRVTTVSHHLPHHPHHAPDGSFVVDHQNAEYYKRTIFGDEIPLSAFRVSTISLACSAILR